MYKITVPVMNENLKRNGGGHIDGSRVVLDDVAAFGFVGFEVRKQGRREISVLFFVFCGRYRRNFRNKRKA